VKAKPSSAATSPSCCGVGTLTVFSGILILRSGERPLARGLLRIAAACEVADPFRPALFGMPASGGDRKCIAGAVEALAAIAHDRHLALEDQQFRVELMGMLGVCRGSRHPAVDDLEIALRLALALELRPVHRLFLRPAWV